MADVWSLLTACKSSDLILSIYVDHCRLTFYSSTEGCNPVYVKLVYSLSTLKNYFTSSGKGWNRQKGQVRLQTNLRNKVHLLRRHQLVAYWQVEVQRTGKEGDSRHFGSGAVVGWLTGISLTLFSPVFAALLQTNISFLLKLVTLVQLSLTHRSTPARPLQRGLTCSAWRIVFLYTWVHLQPANLVHARARLSPLSCPTLPLWMYPRGGKWKYKYFVAVFRHL